MKLQQCRVCMGIFGSVVLLTGCSPLSQRASDAPQAKQEPVSQPSPLLGTGTTASAPVSRYVPPPSRFAFAPPAPPPRVSFSLAFLADADELTLTRYLGRAVERKVEMGVDALTFQSSVGAVCVYLAGNRTGSVTIPLSTPQRTPDAALQAVGVAALGSRPHLNNLDAATWKNDAFSTGFPVLHVLRNEAGWYTTVIAAKDDLWQVTALSGLRAAVRETQMAQEGNPSPQEGNQ